VDPPFERLNVAERYKIQVNNHKGGEKECFCGKALALLRKS
jgi:hypothetical protein